MPIQQNIPDLFVVMSDEELKEAIQYGKENGTKKAIVYEGIQYYLEVNGVDIEDFVKETNSWFPMFTEYIELPTDNDRIGILLSPTVWNNYHLELLYKTLEEEKIKYQKNTNCFMNEIDFKNYKEDEQQASLEEPINSPWTARDLEVVETALNSIEDIKNAILIRNANFKIICTFSFHASIPIATKLPIAEFFYPNILHLKTENGYFNVYMGENVVLEEVVFLLKERKVEYFYKEYNVEDTDLLLYQPRNRKR